jgi:hypothetical protein
MNFGAAFFAAPSVASHLERRLSRAIEHALIDPTQSNAKRSRWRIGRSFRVGTGMTLKRRCRGNVHKPG